MLFTTAVDAWKQLSDEERHEFTETYKAEQANADNAAAPSSEQPGPNLVDAPYSPTATPLAAASTLTGSPVKNDTSEAEQMAAYAAAPPSPDKVCPAGNGIDLLMSCPQCPDCKLARQHPHASEVCIGF